ncbi:MAG: metalloregulator ArsR/SmtB family transcription factor, partial [Myxococcales bacterium]|nr:metalloregulator ArsR/SmtB family transcription factor [Myxococcales bacterium]
MPDPAAAFAALGDPVRLALIRALLDGPVRSSQLAQRVGIARPAASRHLRVLGDAGLVRAEVDASDHRVRIYSLSPHGFEDPRAFLDEVETFWRGQLSAFAAFAEKAQANGREGLPEVPQPKARDQGNCSATESRGIPEVPQPKA